MTIHSPDNFHNPLFKCELCGLQMYAKDVENHKIYHAEDLPHIIQLLVSSLKAPIRLRILHQFCYECGAWTGPDRDQPHIKTCSRWEMGLGEGS